jgi:hypothetical protein
MPYLPDGSPFVPLYSIFKDQPTAYKDQPTANDIACRQQLRVLKKNE